MGYCPWRREIFGTAKSRDNLSIQHQENRQVILSFCDIMCIFENIWYYVFKETLCHREMFKVCGEKKSRCVHGSCDYDPNFRSKENKRGGE